MSITSLLSARPCRRRAAAVGLAVVLFGAACAEDDDGIDAVLDDPGRLRGQSPEQIEAMFGAPRFQRVDGTARIWQYAAPDCFVDLFFYPDEDAPDGPVAVVHFEIRDRTDQPVTSRGCLAALAIAQAEAR